ncbi:alpha/beta fold hydrolase [Lentibacillus sp. JNUCC-1]|uniref:alpha/beta fold hydrolase n=1 Tax=Lentibacillus sp. JNUCC-1 TaxID=2654513 RepID=UPI001E284327|nr:alpha/beta hydrolase [Lentibacillus sp. JNUCC-1]
MIHNNSYVVSLCDYKWGDMLKQKQTEFRKTILTLMDTEIYCEYTLNGKPPLILIHGFVASSYTFNPIMPLLAQDFSVIAIDLPGFGRSEKSKHFTYSYENYAKLISECLDYFHFDKITLVGHSMGGQIALYTARLIPKKIEKLVLISCSAYLGPSPKRMMIASHLPFFHLFAKYIVQKNGVKDTLKNVLYDQKLVTEELVQEYGRPLEEKDFYKGLVRFLREREGDLSSEELKKINHQALLIWGEADKVVPLKAGKKLATDLPNATLKTYPKTGHLITEERPLDIYHQIKNW